MNDWNSWLSSNETRTAIKLLEETAVELKNMISDGSHIQEKSIEKISLDYTYSLGLLEGLRTALQLINDIKEEADDRD